MFINPPNQRPDEATDVLVEKMTINEESRSPRGIVVRKTEFWNVWASDDLKARFSSREHAAEFAVALGAEHDLPVWIRENAAQPWAPLGADHG